MSPEPLFVDTEVVEGWRADFDRIDGHRHLRSVPNPHETSDERWRRVEFREPGDQP